LLSESKSVKPGDAVRFKPPYYLNVLESPTLRKEADSEVSVVGLLVGYESWEKMAEVLYNGKVYRIIARHVEKAGKKDKLILDNRAKTAQIMA